MLTIQTFGGHPINDGTSYVAGFTPGAVWGLPDAKVQSMERDGAWPVFRTLRRKQVKMSIFISIEDRTNVRTLRGQLLRWFDPEDETPKYLVITDTDTSIDRYVLAVCEKIRPVIIGATASCSLFRVDLVVHGDVRWRASFPTMPAAWVVTGTGDTELVVNTGEDEAYPTITIEPTIAKTSNRYRFKSHAMVTWRALNAGPNYPIRLGPYNTAALVTATKMLATGDDLRLFVDGREIPRHLDDMNSANTYIWFSVDWLSVQNAELRTAIAGAGTIDTIDLEYIGDPTGDMYPVVEGFPESGAVRIDDEVFLYTGRDIYNNSLTGVTRTVWGTTIAAHNIGADIWWMQHEIVIVYGNAAAAAPAASLETKPVFTLADSSNTSWKFEDFGDHDYPNLPAQWGHWGPLTLAGNGGCYSSSHRNLIMSPYTEPGAWLDVVHGGIYGWYLDNPCGIVNAAWSGGEKRAQIKEDFLVHLRYWIRGAAFWTTQVTLADPGANNNWEAWAEPAAGADWSPSDSLMFAAYFYAQDVEADTVVVSLNANETPVTAIGPEEGNYTLAATITNVTTGEAITVTFEMALDEELEIDTTQFLVTYLLDDSNQFQAVSPSTARRTWLRLMPGNNTLRFTDVGTAGNGVTITIVFYRRYY